MAIEANCARRHKLCHLALSAPASDDDGILVGLTSPFHARMHQAGLRGRPRLEDLVALGKCNHDVSSREGERGGFVA
jgi:hypothetical protein